MNRIQKATQLGSLVGKRAEQEPYCGREEMIGMMDRAYGTTNGKFYKIENVIVEELGEPDSSVFLLIRKR